MQRSANVHTAPAARRALSHLRMLVASAAPGTRLPSIRSLAANAKVGYSTMRQTVSSMCADGCLVTRPGDGVYVGHIPDAPRSDEPRCRWRQVHRSIERQLIGGSCGANDLLPSTKELIERHGVSYRTLTKALEALRADGIIRRHRTRWRMVSPSRGPGSTVLICTASAGDGRVLMHSVHTYPLFVGLQTECTRIGVDASVVALRRRFRYAPGHEDAARRLEDTARSGTVVGGIVLGALLTEPTITSAVEWFRARGLPCAFLEEGERRRLPSSLSKCRHFSFAGSPHAGRVVGRYVYGLGHRRIGFLSCNSRTEWSRARLAGLRQACGGGAVVTEHTVPIPSATGAAAPETNRGRNRAFAALAATLGFGHLSGHRKGALIGDVLRTVGKHLRHSAIEAAVAGLVAQARAAGCTALVCANDSAALAALDILRARGVSVPEEISVVGFDDTLEAHQVRLTSYNFGALQAARALVNHVLSPRTRRQRQERVEVDGFVVKRASCGRAPQPANARRRAGNP